MLLGIIILFQRVIGPLLGEALLSMGRAFIPSFILIIGIIFLFRSVFKNFPRKASSGTARPSKKGLEKALKSFEKFIKWFLKKLFKFLPKVYQKVKSSLIKRGMNVILSNTLAILAVIGVIIIII